MLNLKTNEHQMESLKNFIEGYTKLTDDDWNLIRSNFEKKEFQPNDLILEIGSVCRHFYFLEEGLIRFYNIIDGSDVTKTFTIPPYCFTSRVSFRKQEPSKEGIQCLDKTVVWQITYSQYQNLTELYCWNLFIRKIINEVQDFAEEFYLEAKTLTAEKRYLNLLNKYPAHLLNKIPLKHLSTFLGIAPQSLSRIRKKYLNSGN